MSMFRKPKKIQRRVFCADDDEDGEPEPPQPPPPPIISNNRKENKQIKTTTLLSFADEEEEGEVFKVKKSSQSKRLSKRREKEKRRVPDGDDHKYDNHFDEEKTEEKEEPRKKVSLEGLILSGREAVSAVSGDPGGESSGESGEEDNRGFHTYRAESVRAALAGAGGRIPDAALIHAARKTRQQARELGDFVPIQSDSGSRMMRDDDGDDDDDDEEEGRIQVRGLELPSDKPQRGTAAAASDEEMNSGGEEWEEQQIKKAMPSITDITGDMVPLNPFSQPPPAPAPKHLRAFGNTAPATAKDLVNALRERLSEAQACRSSTALRRARVAERALAASRVRDARDARRGDLGRKYRRAQAARGYITDLVECLDEKMPQLEALEARALALHRRRRDLLVERRRADVRDQAQDVLALAARAGASKPVDNEEKRQRTAEREGRRRARRLKREAAGNNAHRDGDSSDDDLPPALAHHCAQEAEAIRSLSSQLFADALFAYRGVRGVCARVARLRRARSLYTDAYVAQCLPRLLAPYVRHQLILWNPLADEDNDDYEKMDWYKCLMMYGCKNEKLSSESEQSSDEEEAFSERSVREDPDLMLVPTIIDKVVLPKVTELVEHAWDPMCVRACVRVRQVLVRATELPAQASLARLAAAVRSGLAAALHADVFLPTLPPHIVEGPGGPFWRRCLGSGVRLLRAVLCVCAPPSALAADSLALALVETLCCAAGAAPGACGAAAASALADTLPRAGPVRAPALARLAALAALALSRLHSDNPLHLKALEQARSVIAEARAAE